MEHQSARLLLFGSRAQGTNRAESDFDLLVVTSQAEEVRRTVIHSALEEKIQLLVKSPEEMLDLAIKEPVLTEEIRKGIILWQK